MRLFRKFLVVFGVFLFLTALLGAIATFAAYSYITRDLPKLISFSDYRPPVTTRVYAADGSLMGEFSKEHRHFVRFDEIPPVVVQAFLAAEDADFYKHKGVDLMSVARAVLTNLKAGEVKQGGSTITQQVVKSLLLTPERTVQRKLKEWWLSYQIEKRLTKDEILTLYLNQIFLGHGAYGIAAAWEVYFGKPLADATLGEATVIAGLPKAPSHYNPFQDYGAAKLRQRYVLDQMVRNAMIDGEQAEAIYKQPIPLIQPDGGPTVAPEFLEHVRRDLVERFGNDAVLEQGMSVFTALDPALQVAARNSVRGGLETLDKQIGYRGPIERLAWERVPAMLDRLKSQPIEIGTRIKGIVKKVDDTAGRVQVDLGATEGVISIEKMSWARPPDPEVDYRNRVLRKPSGALGVGDLIWVKPVGELEPGKPVSLSLEQSPEVQGALLAIDPESREVKAMIGGYDPASSQFNRAIQARRQPGSSFKPVIYATALENGYTPATIVVDAPLDESGEYRSFAEGPWRPQNYDGEFKGPMTVRAAIKDSRNIPAIKILRSVGLKKMHAMAKRLGFESPIADNLTAALGSSDVTLLEVVNAYATFDAGGVWAKPVFVRSIDDRDGKTIEKNEPQGRQAMSPSVAYLTTYLLTQVIQDGTGRAALKLGRPAAGKTGTTNDYTDAWFVGYTPGLVCGVWTGLDDHRSLGKGETGGNAALPMWIAFMQAALSSEPARPFKVPGGVTVARVDDSTGLLAGPDSMGRILDMPFVAGTEPSERPPLEELGETAPDFFRLD